MPGLKPSTLARITVGVAMMLALALPCLPAHAASWKLESAEVTLPATDVGSSFVSVPFRQVYASPPVVLVLGSSVDSAPVSVRVRNVTATGFECVQVEPSGDGPHGVVVIHYLAVEAGSHLLPDGRRLEAGLVSTSAVQHGSGVTGTATWEAVSFSQAFVTSPVVVTQIQTTANETAAVPEATSVPWLVSVARDAMESGFKVALERGEAAAGEVTQPESIAYVALEPGTVTLPVNGGGTVTFEGLATATAITGWDNGCVSVAFGGTYSAAPLVVGSQMTRNGGDGGWSRRCSLDATAVGLATDEDQAGDSERSHTSEADGLVVLSESFDAIVEEPATVGFGAASQLVEETAGSAALTVMLSHATATDLTVDYATADGTATAGADYTATSGTLTIPAGQTQGTIAVPILNDANVESLENFQVALSNPSGAFLAAPTSTRVDVRDDDSASLPGWRMESGEVTLPATDVGSSFVSVPFRQTYGSPPVVLVLGSSEDSAPVSVRVRNVTGSGFECVQVEPSGDGPHGAVVVHYLAVEPGLHLLPDGRRLEAGLVSTSMVQHGSGVTGTATWEAVSFSQAFGTLPVVVTQIQTMANETAAVPEATSVPWLVSTVRDVTDAGFSVALERGEVAAGEVTQPESIGYVALEPGVVTLPVNGGGTVTFDSLATATAITGWDNGCVSVAFGGTYSAAPLVVSSQMTRNGGDGGWSRRCSLDATAVGLATDEDQAGDSERSHTSEADGLLVLSEPFDAAVEEPATVGFGAASQLVEEPAGNAALTVTLSHASSTDITVDYATADGTATAGADYTATSGTLTIPAGQTQGTITIPILDDAGAESQESFQVTLSNPSGGFLSSQATIRVDVRDDDSASLPGWRMESGEVTLPATDVGSPFVSVPFRQVYVSPPVVVVLGSSADSAPVSVRVRNVTANGFECVQVEPSGDGPHGEVVVHYLAVEPGTHVLPDRRRLEAGLVSTSMVQHGSGVTGGTSWETVSFTQAFSVPPVVVTQIQTTANETAAVPGALSVPWLVSTVRDVTDAGFSVALERGEVVAGEVTQAESIGYLALEPGTVTLPVNGGGNVAFEGLATSMAITGWDNGCVSVAFGGAYSAAPLVVGSQTTRNGGDGGWLRRCSLDAAAVGLATDEDQAGDSERSHTSEADGLVVFSGSFDAAIEEPAPAVVALTATNLDVTESAGSLEIVVTLSQPASGAESVDYATADGTATAGADYTATSGTLTFAAGETTASFSIPILDDTQIESGESFQAGLSNPQGCSLGDPATATVQITDDDATPEPIVYSVSTDTAGVSVGTTTVSLSDGVATFNGDLVPTTPEQDLTPASPGMQLTYGPASSVVFIRRCLDNKHCEVTTPSGGVPPDATDEPVLDLRHAFASLSSAVSGAGDADHLGTYDLTAAGVSLTLACYGSGAGPDQQPVMIDGWVTSSADTITVSAGSCDGLLGSCGGRHDGAWDGSAYRLEVAGASCITITVGNVTIDGLQLYCSGDPAADVYGVLLDGAALSGPVKIAQTLIRLDGAEGDGDRVAIASGEVGAATLILQNDVMYDLGTAGAGAHGGVLASDDTLTVLAYSNTVVGGAFGIRRTAGTVTAKNDIATGSTGVRFDGTFSPDSTNNVSSDDTAPGANAVHDTFVSFFNSTSGTDADYHLACTPYDQGADLSNHTEIGSGNVQDLFDGEVDTLVVSASVNPAVYWIVFPEPRTVTSTRIFVTNAFDHEWEVEAADTAEDMYGKTGSYQDIVPVRYVNGEGLPDPFRLWDEVVFATPVTARVFRLTVHRLSGDDYVHVSEWKLDGINAACGGGADLSADPQAPFRLDVGTMTRTSPWDAGADQARDLQVSVEPLHPDHPQVWEEEGQITLDAVISEPLTYPIQVPYYAAASMWGGAEPGVDFGAVHDLVTIPAGETRQSFVIPVYADGEDDDGEDFYAAVGGPSGTLGTGRSIWVFTHDGPAPPRVALVSDVAVPESSGTADLEVTLSEPSTSTVTVDWRSHEGTALTGVDFGEAHGTLTFDPGVTSQTLSLPILDDDIPEANETARVMLTWAEGGQLSPPASAWVTIVDDDTPEVALSADSYSVSEGGGQLVVTAILSGALDHDITVDYATLDGTATAGADYEATIGTLTIPAGQIQAELAVPILDDSDQEGDETFTIELSNASGAALGAPSTAQATIVDDEVTREVSFSSATYQVAEDGGTATISVVLSGPAATDVTVDYATADGTATAGADYEATSGTLTIPSGQTQADLIIPILDDTDQEGDETFTIGLSNASGAALGALSAAQATIVDNEVVYQVSFSSVAYQVAEDGGAATISVVLSGPAATDVTVDYATADGTAVAGSDYESANGTLTIPAGSTSASFGVTILTDDEPEGDETVLLQLSNPSGAELGSPAAAQLTILANSGPVQVTLWAASSVAENGNLVTVNIGLDRSSASTITVDLATVDGTATAGADYEAVTQTVSFTPGQTTATVDVTIDEDALHEADETFDAVLSNPVGAVLGSLTTATVTITDNDWPPAVYLADGGHHTAVYTAGENIGSVVIPVRLSDVSGVETTVDYATSDLEAVAGQDYEAQSGTLTFAPGETEQLITIPIMADGEADSGERFHLELSDPVEAGLDGYLPYEGNITIFDGLGVYLDSSEYQTLEGEQVYARAYLPVPMSTTVTVDYATADGTAVAGQEYNGTSGTFTFAPGQTSKSVAIQTIENPDPGEDTAFTVSLSNPTGLPLVDPWSAEVTILDDDQPRAYDLRVIHVAPDLVHMTWDSTAASSFQVDRRDADVGGTWEPVANIPTVQTRFWRDFGVAPGIRYEYRVTPFDGDGTPGPETTVTLDSPVPEGEQAVVAVVPGMASVVPPATPLPEHANAYSHRYDYVFHLTPDPSPDFVNCTVDVYVDGEAAAADPDEPSQPLDEPFGGRARDELGCLATDGTKVVDAQACDGATCDVVVPNLATGVHSFLFVLTDASGDVSRRAIVQDMQPWWPTNLEATADYPPGFVYLFSDHLNSTQPTLFGQERALPVGADSPDCGDTVDGGTVSLQYRRGPYFYLATEVGVVDGGGVQQLQPTVSDGETTLFIAPTSSGTFGRNVTKRGSGGEDWGGLQHASAVQNAVATALVVDTSLPTDQAPQVAYVSPAVVDADGSATIYREVWIRVADDDQDVDPGSVTVQNLTYDGGTETFPAYYADPAEQDRAEGRFGWFVSRLPMSVGSNDLAIHGEDRAGHTVDDMTYSVERIVAADGTYPVPIISQPRWDQRFSHDQALSIDASASTVPSGYQVWLGVLEAGSGDPMLAALETSELTSSFTDADQPEAYVVRLVIATPGSMPSSDQLRGEALPCTLGAPGLGCASTQVVIRSAASGAITTLEAPYAFPEVVLLRWAPIGAGSVQRSDDGGVTWASYPVEGSQLWSYHDRAVEPGHTYFYRVSSTSGGPVYVGGGLSAPGQPVQVPVWDAPRVLPSYTGWTWDCPTGAWTGYCHVTVSVHLDAEPGGTLAGTTIRAFVNEETFQITNGVGDEIPVQWADDNGPVHGRDEPGCVIRKTTPDVEVTVPSDQDSVDLQIPGLDYGANSLRFEVTTPSGGYSERALLFGAQGTVGQYQVTAWAMPLLFGDQGSELTPTVRGVAPVWRPSPDCADADRSKSWGTNLYKTNVYWWVQDSGTTWLAPLGLGSDGSWELTVDNLEDQKDWHIWLEPYACWEGGWGQLGRAITDADGSVLTTSTAQAVCVDGPDSGFMTLDTTLEGGVGHAPVLSYVPDVALNSDVAGDGTLPLKYRVSDLHHDVDLDTLTVTNNSLDPPQTVPGYYASYQIDADHGNLGWLVAEVPVVTDADNVLSFHVGDLAGNVLDETRTVTLADSLPPPEVSFSAATYTGGENGGSVAVTVQLSRAPGVETTVHLATTAGGTATPNVDYTPMAVDVTFHAQDTSISYLVQILDDVEAEDPETVLVGLSNPQGCVLANPSTATVTILDNDTAFDGLAPGLVTEGGTFRVYSHTLEEGTNAYVFIDDDWTGGADPVMYELPVQPGGYMVVTPDPADVPAGLYYVAMAPTPNGQKSKWLQALDVVEAGSQAAPLVVDNEEDDSCEGPGTECVHPIAPGQTWQGEWGQAGDRDYFGFVVGSGVQLQITLDFIEGTEGIGDDSRPPDPEVTIVGPSGIYTLDSYADDRGTDDTNATLTWTTEETGVHVIIASTKRGTGQYLVYLEVLGEAAGQEFRLEPYHATTHLVWSNEEDMETGDPLPAATLLEGHIIDPFGQPVAGAKVSWETVSGSPGLTGSSYRSSWDGHVAVDVDMSSSDEAEIQASVSLPSLPSIPQAQRVSASRAHTRDPLIGVLHESGGAVLDDTPEDPETVRRLQMDRDSRSPEEPRTPDDTPITTMAQQQSGCGGTSSVPFYVFNLVLPANARALKTLEFSFNDGASTLDRLEGLEVVQPSEPLTVSAIATFYDKASPPGTFTQDIACDLPLTIEALGAPGLGYFGVEPGVSVDDGGTWCSRAYLNPNMCELDPSPLLYRTGSLAVYLARFVEADPDPFKYGTEEILRASLSAPLQIPSGSGSYLVRRVATTGDLPVAPKPGPPRSIHFLPPDGPIKTLPYLYPVVHPSMSDDGQPYSYELGPQFELHDEYENKNVEAGWRGPGNVLTDASVGLTDGGGPPDSPWFGVGFPGDGTHYQVRAIVESSGIPISVGTYAKTLHVDSDGAIPDQVVTVEVVTDVPMTEWNCPTSNTDLDCGGYSIFGGGFAQPGGPVLARNGNRYMFRIHPILNTEFGDSAPSQLFTDIPYRVYLSGPSSCASCMITDGQGKPVQREDVQFIPASVTIDESGQPVVTPGVPVGGQIQVTTTTGSFPGAAGQDEGTAIWVSEAPKDPGYYQVIAEPLDPAFIGQYTDWNTMNYAILVAGARLLHEDYSAVGYETIDHETTYWLEYVTAGAGGPPNLVYRYEDAEGNVEEKTVWFRPGVDSLLTCTYVAELHLKPTDKPIIGEPEPCPDCTVINVHPTAFKIQVGEPGDPMPMPLDTMYGHGAVAEIPLGEYRRLTYAIQTRPSDTPGAGDHSIVTEWKDEWDTVPPFEMDYGNPWFSTLVNPTTNGDQLTYSFGPENAVSLTRGTVTIDSFAFRNIKEADTDVGYVRAFHAASDLEHRFVPPDPNLQPNGYGPERVDMTLADSAHTGQEATIRLRGILPEHIQGEVCRLANSGNEDRSCGTSVKDDYQDSIGHHDVLFNLDDIILYFADRNGFPPDITKAQAFHESPGTSDPDKIQFQTNLYRYEPYTWDLEMYSGCLEGTSHCVLGSQRRVLQNPYLPYVIGGTILDAESDGVGIESPAAFAGTLSTTVPAGSPASGYTVSIPAMTPSDPAIPPASSFPQLYIVRLKDSPYCIDQSDAACRNPPSATPSYDAFAIRLCQGACSAGTEWNQVASDQHRMLVTGHDTTQTPRDPINDGEFRLAYSAGQTFAVDFGASPTADLTLSLRPEFTVEVTAGGHPLPAGVVSITDFLTHRTRDLNNFGLEYTEGDTISEWVNRNWSKGSNQGFLRTASGHADWSQNWFLLNLGTQGLYDPKYSMATAQFVLAGSFGLMQTGIVLWGNDPSYPNRETMLNVEFDPTDPDRHVFEWITDPWMSIRVGGANDGYLLYEKGGFESACPETCERSILRSRIHFALSKYNTSSYADAILDIGLIQRVSPHPDTWR